MSSQEITYQFRKFGFKIIIIGLLAIISIIFVFINFIVNFRTLEFVGFRSSILFIFAFIWPFGLWAIIASIFQIVLNFTFLFILGNIKKAAHALYNGDLIRIHSKMIVVSIMRIIGYSIYAIVNNYLMTHLITTRNFFGIAYAFVALGGAFIILFIAAILDIQVWSTLKRNFSYTIKSSKAKNGTLLCMIGAIFNIYPIFWYIGEIFKIIGYYFLSNLRNLDEGAIIITPPSPPQPMQILPTPKQEQIKRFCANCGNPLKETEKFCTSCGLKI